MRVYSALFCLAIALPSFGVAAGKDKNDWGRLAQIPGVQTVVVDLRDGRTLKGNVLEFRPDGLSFIDERKLKK